MKGKLANLLKGIRKEYTVSSAVIILLGIVLTFFPKNSTKLLCYSVAAFFALIGVIVIVRYVKAGQRGVIASASLVAGALLVLFGIYIFIKPLSLANILWLTFGIILVVDGVYKIMHAITLGKNGAERWWTVLVAAAVMTLFGLIIILEHSLVSIAFVRLVGVAFILDGIADLYSTIYLSRVIKKLEPEFVETQLESVEVELIETEE